MIGLIYKVYFVNFVYLLVVGYKFEFNKKGVLWTNEWVNEGVNKICKVYKNY